MRVEDIAICTDAFEFRLDSGLKEAGGGENFFD
jgi:hypothetical protein